jgi:hypothetical protein
MNVQIEHPKASTIALCSVSVLSCLQCLAQVEAESLTNPLFVLL